MQSAACFESNSSSVRSTVYSTATKPSELYERRCSLDRNEWKFANYNLYEGPHQTIVDEVSIFPWLTLNLYVEGKIFYISIKEVFALLSSRVVCVSKRTSLIVFHLQADVNYTPIFRLSLFCYPLLILT